MTTQSGYTYDPSKPFRSNLIMKLDGNGRQHMQSLKFISVSTPYKQHFREMKCDFKVEDELGQVIDICEDYIWQ